MVVHNHIHKEKTKIKNRWSLPFLQTKTDCTHGAEYSLTVLQSEYIQGNGKTENMLKSPNKEKLYEFNFKHIECQMVNRGFELSKTWVNLSIQLS